MLRLAKMRPTPSTLREARSFGIGTSRKSSVDRIEEAHNGLKTDWSKTAEGINFGIQAICLGVEGIGLGRETIGLRVGATLAVGETESVFRREVAICC